MWVLNTQNNPEYNNTNHFREEYADLYFGLFIIAISSIFHRDMAVYEQYCSQPAEGDNWGIY